MQAAIEVAKSEFGRLDGVVHCAGVIGAARLVGKHGPHDLALFERVVRVNLVGTFNVARLAAAAMTTSALADSDDGERGVIVTTASVAAFDGQIGQAAYAASKGGVASLTLPLGSRVGPVRHSRGGDCSRRIRHGDDGRHIGRDARVAGTSKYHFRRGSAGPMSSPQFACQIIENPMLNGSVIRLDGALRMGSQ